MIDVAMTSWPNHPDRLKYFRWIVDAHRKFLTASRHELRFFCSAESERDPTEQWCGHELESLCVDREISLVWRDEPASLGANMNAALAMCTAPAILLQQDDHRLERPLDLSNGADFLLANRGVDLLRYSWPTAPGQLPTFIEQPRWPHGYRQIDLQGNWPYGDDPHLRRQDFVDRYGCYCEGGRHGSSESTLLRLLVKQRATIAADATVAFRHRGNISAVINDHRTKNGERQRWVTHGIHAGRRAGADGMPIIS